MNDDQLREQLGRLDPLPAAVPVDPPTSLRAQSLLERTMLTADAAPDTTSPAPLWRRPLPVSVAVLAVAVLGVGSVVALTGGGSSSERPQSTLALRTRDGGSGISLGSCLPFSVDILKDVPLAFGGTVTNVADGTVSISVEHWYKGGDATAVTISTPPANTSAGPVEFVKGRHYLVSATNGVVNGCGLSGEASSDLTSSFEQAFPS